MQMKRCVVGLLLLLLFSATAYAGDLPEAITTRESCDVFLGTVTAANGQDCTIEVEQALFHNYDVATVTLPAFVYYGGAEGDNMPRPGDLCAVAAEYIDGQWQVFEPSAPMAAKSDSLAPETLTLENPKNMAFITRMNEYINEGVYSAANRKEAIAQKMPYTGDSIEPEAASSAAQSIAIRLEESAEKQADAQIREIARNTEIAAVPPIAVEPKPKGKIPGYIRYPLLFFGAMGISYFLTNGSRRQRRRDCPCKDELDSDN